MARQLKAAWAVAGLGILVASSSAWAQNNPQNQPRQNPQLQQRNNAQVQPRDPRTAKVQTIRGVVSGVTAAGEAVFDQRTRQAVMAEMSYLTIVGSPVGGDSANKDANKDKDSTANNRENNARAANTGDNAQQQDNGRHNIYVVWMSPRTKITTMIDQSGKESTKRDATVDQIEVGDRVEFQFVQREESPGNAGATQTDTTRRKHGRQRTYWGDAQTLTILPPKHDNEPATKE
jgi:hypothetical protein